MIDLAPTLLDAAGVPVPAEIQGRSLRPLLAGNVPDDWRKSFYYHYYEYPSPHQVRPHYGVVTDRFKLVHFYEPDVDYWELYDREKDPNELRNAIADEGYAATVAGLRKEVARLREELKVPAEDPPGAMGNAPRGTKRAVGGSPP